MIQNWLNSKYSWRFVVMGMLLLGMIAAGVMLHPRPVHADPVRLPELRPAALAGICDSVTTIPRAECDALVAFYNATDGPHWTSKPRWLQTSLPCYWAGVQCTGGHVTYLKLVSNNLNGPVPLVLTSLPLEVLDLSSNELVGTIPPELGNMTSLTVLDLSHNRLGSSIPSTLGNLVNLEELLLDANMFGGEIPSTLTQLTRLRYLSVRYNILTASDPTLITFLKRFDYSWRSTQTVPPPGVALYTVTQSSVEIMWDRLLVGDGHYEVGYGSRIAAPDFLLFCRADLYPDLF
jgi:hypothetical protein